MPESSYDVVLFAALAVLCGCLLQGRLNSLLVLLAGRTEGGMWAGRGVRGSVPLCARCVGRTFACSSRDPDATSVAHAPHAHPAPAPNKTIAKQQPQHTQKTPPNTQNKPQGGVIMAFAYPFNLLRLGNSISWWLGIAPWQLFFYVFLPPLLLDAAVRIDWFIFRKVGCAVVCCVCACVV